MPLRPDDRQHKRYLDLAARIAWRGWGLVEPNPMVGCVIVRSGSDGSSRIVGIGHHRRFGGLHAEREALASCARLGEPGAARGATAYVTLEPCNGQGKQPPCVEALKQAGVARVIFAERDPSENKGGGAEALARSGTECVRSGASFWASRTSAPWRKHRATGLPWVILKLAQTIDGKVATRSGDSKWISDEHSRRWVHLVRGRVQGILTATGTVLADDPLLTPRGVPVRRMPGRVVLDSSLRLPVTSQLVRTATPDSPVWAVCADQADPATTGRRAALERPGLGVRVFRESGAEQLGAIAHGPRSARLDLRGVLAWMGDAPENGGLGMQTVLVEAGPRLAGQILRHRLVDEALFFTAPVALGDALAPGLTHAPGDAAMPLVSTIAEARDGQSWRLAFTRRVAGGVGADAMTLWTRTR